jgi:site-specific DNA-methyltransferase (adenine-specific)
MKSEVFNIDCKVGMKSFPDGYFDLAVVDPPYGHGDNLIRKGNTRGKIARPNNFHPFDNSKSPDPEYFKELIRVSKHQIIWGANHFADKFNAASSCWIIWDKETTGDFADCELAYTSFGTACRRFRYMWNGMHQGGFGGNTKLNEKRIHPTQKPVVLYDWIYKNYLPQGGKVIDTHLGSGSNRIAAYKAGNIDFTAYEIDPEYFESQEKRFQQFKSQLRMQF